MYSQLIEYYSETNAGPFDSKAFTTQFRDKVASEYITQFPIWRKLLPFWGRFNDSCREKMHTKMPGQSPAKRCDDVGVASVPGNSRKTVAFMLYLNKGLHMLCTMLRSNK
jgi:hypothetical protein